MSAYDYTAPAKPAHESATIQGAALAAAPVLLRMVRTRRVTLTDAVALGGLGMAIWGRFRARGPVRL